jgi:riboflavin kinase/FMN adenylyltransferase
MRVWRSLEEVPDNLGHTVVTVGNFDGVHLGHQHVIARARRIADRLNLGHVVAVTFDPHPIAVLRPEHAPPTLTDLDHRVELLGAAGVDDVLILPFTREIADWSPERFVEEILVETLHAAAVVVGANFRFGRRAAGDVALLRQLGVEFEFLAEGVSLEGGPQVWSSTYIRTCLAAGDVEGAAEALGYPVTVRGTVEQGDRRGRELGYPTANVPTRSTAAVPADGVYAGWLRVIDGPGKGLGTDESMPAAISVGANPTFAGERERRVEAHVIDRGDLELYGRDVEVVFVHRLRGMVRFASVDELVAAMDDDVTRARALLHTATDTAARTASGSS